MAGQNFTLVMHLEALVGVPLIIIGYELLADSWAITSTSPSATIMLCIVT